MKVLSAEYGTSAASPEGFPCEGPAEVAFLGRSNVGKSSLLNRLVGRRQLARTSSTPGKTRLIHFYEVRGTHGGSERKLRLVDLPGYGWARVSKSERRSWQRLVEGYLATRRSLGTSVLLQDLRRDVSEDETDLVDWLLEREIPVLIALTKIDKLKPMRRAERIRIVRSQFAEVCVVATSAETGDGIAELWREILRTVVDF